MKSHVFDATPLSLRFTMGLNFGVLWNHLNGYKKCRFSGHHLQRAFALALGWSQAPLFISKHGSWYRWSDTLRNTAQTKSTWLIICFTQSKGAIVKKAFCNPTSVLQLLIIIYTSTKWSTLPWNYFFLSYSFTRDAHCCFP